MATPGVGTATAGAAAVFVLVSSFFLGSSAAPAAEQRTVPAADQSEWTQWRGAGRDGVVSTEARAGEWPDQMALLWEQEVGGGYSGPVVAGDRVWVFTRRGEVEVVSSLTLSDGRTVWRRRYEVPFEQDHDALQHGRGPYGTPALADGRLFTFGVTSVLSAWDARSGGLLWRTDYSSEFERSFPYFGQAGSPLVWGELCFAHFGVTNGEASDRGAMVALDVADGSERWRWDGDAPPIGSSPVIATISGRPQLVFKSKMNIVGLDPETGAELWRIPYRVSQDNTIVTPLFIGAQLVTSDWDMGAHSWMIEREAGGAGQAESEGDTGAGSGAAEVKADAGSDSWRARKLWQTRDASIFTSSPVLVRSAAFDGAAIDGTAIDGAGGLVVGFSHLRSGQLFGMDPGSGEVLWRGDGRSGEHVSLVVWGNELLVFQEDGSLVVGEVTRDGFRPLRTYDLGRSIAWAHPAVVDDRIVVRDGSRLAVFGFE